jgi:SnoaL-like domain
VNESPGDSGAVAERIRAAFVAHDVDAFGALLRDDVHWGDDSHPRRCRNRGEVLAIFNHGLANGLDATITELATGSRGVLCGLSMTTLTPVKGVKGEFFHVYLVDDDQAIYAILRFDDRRSAMVAAGL